MNSTAVPPLKFRRIRAQMELKCLTLHDVAGITDIDVSTLSRLLRNHPVANADSKFLAVRKAVEGAPMPQEEVAA